MLGMADPCDTKCKRPLCAALEVAEEVIFVFFFAEMSVKMLAMGVWGRGAYLDEPWNCFDLFIIVVGLIIFFYNFIRKSFEISQNN